MIEETAMVTRIDGGRTWIRSLPGSGCCGCMQQASCGTATLAKMLPKREFAVDCDLGLKVGDRVYVAIDDAHLLLISVLLYLLPLLPMMIGVGLADAFIPALGVWLPEIALALLLSAFWLIHHFQAFLLLHLCLKPRIVGKLSDA
ncbi:MAG: SoxR reducing system RseC family protein [Methylomonas sp.]